VDLTAFAEDVGHAGEVTIAGRATRGGPVDGIRAVSAPAGIDSLTPDEMTVSCGAATPVDELQAALAEVRQFVALPFGGTVGGALAVGQSDVCRLGRGPVRDALLQLRYVSAEGLVVKAGGPTVKNVSGFDLCRLFVGSRGALGFAGDVILRTRPRPAVTQWYSGQTDPFALRQRLYRPSSILWDGVTTWLCLEGHPADVEAQAIAAGLEHVEGPPPLPTGGRASMRPSELRALAPSGNGHAPFVAEVGVGVVHLHEPPPPRRVDPAVVELHGRIKRLFDPTGRLNPGRSPLPALA
jgi:FAD/FMN-containing dehydrogenase